MMKIDVETMEAKVLEGASKLIAKNRPLIYAEANSERDFVKIKRILESMEYAYWDSFGPGLGLTHLFIPLESVSEKQILASNGANLKRLNFDTRDDCKNILDRLRLSKRVQIIEICLLVCIVGLIGLLLLK